MVVEPLDVAQAWLSYEFSIAVWRLVFVSF